MGWVGAGWGGGAAVDGGGGGRGWAGGGGGGAGETEGAGGEKALFNSFNRAAVRKVQSSKPVGLRLHRNAW